MEQAVAVEKQSEDFFDTNMSVGEILRRTRLHYEQSLHDVEKAIRVRASQIEAIENDETEKLPGRVYAIGFVRSYAEYLGLDGGKMVELFKHQQGAQARSPELDFPIPASEGRLPPKWLIFLSLLVVILGPYIAWSIYGGDQKPSLEIVDVPEALKSEDTLMSFETQSSDDTQTQAVMGAQQANNDILIDVVENSWVEIKDSDGEVLIARILEAGEQYYIPNDPDLVLTLGNAGGILFNIEGDEQIKLGDSGESVKDISLDFETLKAYGAMDQKTKSQDEVAREPVDDSKETNATEIKEEPASDNAPMAAPPKAKPATPPSSHTLNTNQ